ncbi:hypothetical protein [Pseudofrankia sp. BMG5.36]|uniref:hypothetical protein n=1 Tax=Pseudofrankia sp. BMG5.36 TaxID=1834512 RepID=UPI0010421E34|nr:hypothetical protein [Pseudofrankia sp. BMG5.36]
MVYLDCHDATSALTSLATAFHLHDDDLARALLECNLETDWTGEREERSIRSFLSEIDVDLDSVRFDGAYYFHGTRSLEPEAFIREGILPLGAVIDRIWSSLYDLVRDQVNESDWQKFRAELERDGGGHSGRLYRIKVSNAFHHGPYAMLVRDNHFNPSTIGGHDYLATPEIVEDIGRAFNENLQERFENKAKKCIVKFRSSRVQGGALTAALWYAYSAVRGDPAGWACLHSIDCKGAILPGAVVGVEQVR